MNVKLALMAALLTTATVPLFTGCATITRGTSEVLVVETDPSGASVRLSNGMVGTTPTSFKIPRKGAVTVTIFKEGYESVEVHVNTQVAGAGAAGMAGNVLVGGLIGVGIDSFSGGMLEHKPNPVEVTLVQKPVVVAGASIPAAVPAAIAPPQADPQETARTPETGPPGAVDPEATPPVLLAASSTEPVKGDMADGPEEPVASVSETSTTSESSTP